MIVRTWGAAVLCPYEEIQEPARCRRYQGSREKETQKHSQEWLCHGKRLDFL